MMLLITSSATSVLVLPVLLPGAEIMFLQEKKKHFAQRQLRGFSMVLHSTMESYKLLQGSLMYTVLHHRNMQISATEELKHQGENC